MINFKILFLIGVASSIFLYQAKHENKADLTLGLTCIGTGIGLVKWTEEYKKESDNRIDKLEIQLQSQAEMLEYANQIGKNLLRLEARIEILKEEMEERNKN